MEHESQHILTYGLVAAAMLAGWIHPLVRRALVDGARCLVRFPVLWRTPLGFALAYGCFQWVAAALLAWRSGEWSSAWIMDGAYAPTPEDLPAGWNPANGFTAIGHTAALGNDLVIPFPLSSVLVIWCVFFCHNLVVQLIRTARRGFPRTWMLVIGVLVASAVAAILKPWVFLFLPEWIDGLPVVDSDALLLASLINAIATVFEVFLGSYVTVYLMLTAFAWVRGLDADRLRLHILTARRMRYVLKWTLFNTVLALLFIVIPNMFGIRDDVGIMAYLAVLIVFFPVQANLVFHNGSLSKAMREALLMILNHRALPMFLIGAAAGFFLLAVAQSLVLSIIPGESPALGVKIGFGAITAVISGWLLATWVCLYRRLGPDRRAVAF